MIATLVLSLGVNLAAGLVLWLVSVRLRNASIVDIFWGPLCAAPAFVTMLAFDGAAPRSAVLTGLVGLWALRLSLHLAKRNIGHGEDFRYVAMRRKHPDDAAFARWSLVWVFGLQALLAWLISLPVQVGQAGPDAALGLLAMLGVAVFCIGLAFEAIGDWQLAAFKKRPENQGRLMTRGLWAWTRHPNYFGDACVWFGLALIALEGPHGWIGAASPLIMAHFLVNISGKALLERSLERKYPDYAAYRASVSGFIPMPPKKPAA